MTLDGDTQQAIVYDVMGGRKPADSKVTYTKEAKAFREEVEAEWDAWSKEHPDAVLYVPPELPSADIKIPDAEVKEGHVNVKVSEAVVLLDKAPIPAKVIIAGADTYVVPDWSGAFTPSDPEKLSAWNSARYDAQDAARVLGDLLRLKGAEANEADDSAQIDTAIAAVLTFIKNEAAEISGACTDCGHAADCSCTVCDCTTHDSIAESGRRNSKRDEATLKQILDLVKSLGITVDPPKEPEPAAEPVAPVAEAAIDADAKASQIVFREATVDSELVTLAEASVRFDDSTRTVFITPIKPGWGNKRDNRYYPTKTLEEATKAGKFDNLKMFADHPTTSADKERPERSVKDWVATTREAEWDVTRQRPVVPLVVHEQAVYQRFKEAPEQVAFSVLGAGVAKPGTVEGKKGVIVESIAKLRSVDWVTEAGAGGGLDFAEAASEEFEVDIQNMTVEQVDALRESNPALYKHLVGLAAAMPDAEKEAKDAAKAAAAAASTKDEKTDAVKESEVPEWARNLVTVVEAIAAKDAAREQEASLVEAKAEADKAIVAVLAASTLPAAAKDAIKATFAEAAVGVTHTTADALKGAVDASVKLAESLFGKVASDTKLVTGLGGKPAQAGEGATSIREAAETRLAERFGVPQVGRKDQLVFTPEQLTITPTMGAATAPGAIDGETPVAEAAAATQSAIEAKF